MLAVVSVVDSADSALDSVGALALVEVSVDSATTSLKALVSALADLEADSEVDSTVSIPDSVAQ